MGYENDSYFPHSGTLSGGLVNWLVVNHKNMLLLRKNSGLKTPPIVAEHWKELISSKTSGNIGLNNIDNQPPPPCQPTNIDNIVGPYLTTTWGQGIPYNLLCPAGTYDNGHTPTGCVATAMAQVMYYWKAPAYYNWNTMPITYNYNDINYPGNRDVAQLMVDVGQSVDMAYSATTSSTDGSKGAAALRNVFHYTSSANGNFDYKKVMNNLDARQPVLLAASTDYHSFLGFNTGYSNGHEWVCDGYEELISRTCPTYNPYTGEIVTPAQGSNYLYLHMNWGWDNQNNCNGWFGFQTWQVFDGATIQNFQYNQTMTYDIHP